MSIKIMTVVGARPNFMKAAPLVAALREHNARVARCYDSSLQTIEHILVHTGQHYDESMSGSFFSDLDLPSPDICLGVGSASHAVQTAEIMKRFEEAVLRERPDVVVVVGDVNSTVACALVAAKITFDSAGSRPLIAHVEAGLRSFDRTMPEECNRVVTDHLSDILFVTEKSGLENLQREGILAEKVHFVGNTMIDSLLAYKDKAALSPILEKLGLRSNQPPNSPQSLVRPYALLTLHRPSNVDDCTTLLEIRTALDELAAEYPIIFPVHPRTQVRIREFGLGHLFQTASTNQNLRAGRGRVYLINPLGYIDFVCLMQYARLVLTDSGGVQEETTCIGVPCVTIRNNTERPVTVENGTNIVAGVSRAKIQDAIRRQLSRTVGSCRPEKWDGRAAERILSVLIRNGQMPR